MVDYVAITALIITLLNTVGGCFAYFHIKLNSDCCGCFTLELTERSQNSIKKHYETQKTVIEQPSTVDINYSKA